MNQLPNVVMKECGCVGTSLHSLLWWESWIWCECESHISQGVLTTVVGHGAGDEEAGTRARCELGLLCSVANITILGVGSGPDLLKQKP